MATWFAQNSSVNIDSVNQWNDAANGSGNWLTWANLGASDTLVANGKSSITINVNTTCALLTTAATGGTAGGGFILDSSVTLTASVTAGASSCVTFSSSGTASIVGNITATNGGFTAGIAITGTGTLTITGNITGGNGNGNQYAHGIRMTTGGVLNVTGSVAGGSYHGIYALAGTVNVTGNVTGGSGLGGGEGQTSYVGASGIGIAGNCVLSVVGYIYGGTYGDATCSTPGIYSTSTSAITVTGAVIGSSVSPSIIQLGNVNVTIYGDIVSSSNGHTIGVQKCLIHATNQVSHTYRINNAGSPGVSRTLYTGGTNLGQPVVANVRSGTVYGASSEYTGTLAVPSPTLVAVGVATDNTVGSYSPSVNASDIRTAVGLASANLDTQLSAKATATNVSDAQVAILAKLPSALVSGRIDASVGAIANDVITAASIAASALNAKGDWNTVAPDNASIAAILEDTGTTIPAQINSVISHSTEAF